MKILINVLFIFSLTIFAFAQNFPDSETDGKYYEVNGAKIWTVSFGTGEPIFFIAGGPGNAHYYLRAFDSLSTTNTLVYFDAFGRGKSDTAKNVGEYSLQRDVEDLEALRKEMGYKSFSILGHSYGGVVAQAYAIKYPDNVSHLILANSFHSFLMWQENCDNSNHEIKTNYPEVWSDLMKVREEGAVSSDQNHQDIYSRVPYGFLYAYNPENFRRSGRKPYPNFMNTKLYYQMVGKDGDFLVSNDIGNFDFRKGLKNLKMPILIYGGRYDRVAVPWMMDKYKEYCPQAKYVIFEKSGHNPQVEEPEATLKLIRDFFNK
ncbi:MAG: alpha/beta fold hydrolase [Ignavibacteriaceae bacterium]|nr:alpha/beta fold hydrolase [Ignavibacterium sp.]MCC6256070.1 alpha/beta fold hydrolase [Ignavibacteriaceae bacterium]HRN26863.1 alpha/beta fold hydrolase [Ignavibacteriaceae bacterium]HRP93912.1 alpha/beta fold hydrolase [Ignavibacteriaceae bacterium]HRQ54481.1 alpha/beta fold hydrolase [Ignavibacteriaceae bacterium]